MRTARRGSLQLRAAGGRALGFGRETSPARARRGSTGSMDGGDGAPVWYIDEVNSDEADSSPDAPWNALEQDSDGSSTLWDDESFDDDACIEPHVEKQNQHKTLRCDEQVRGFPTEHVPPARLRILVLRR